MTKKKCKKEAIIAICYDFDKTLSPQDMQNYKLIPSFKMNVEDFWNEANQNAKQYGMDKILSYMQLIIGKAKAADIRISREDFVALGNGIPLFKGVESWFERINAYAASKSIKIEHYIISAGLTEIIEGSQPGKAKVFKKIYASEFRYGKYGEPIWPLRVVNYTTKTQYLFRISKDCLDLSDEDSVNQYKDNSERRIPFKNFIYIGDSETDIPAMRIVKQGGGVSIGVYNEDSVNIEKVTKLLKQHRIDYFMPANYQEDSELEKLVKNIIDKIKYESDLERIHNNQELVTKIIDDYNEFTNSIVEISENNNMNPDWYVSILKDENARVIKQISAIQEGICNDQIIEKCKGILNEARKAIKKIDKQKKS